MSGYDILEEDFLGLDHQCTADLLCTPPPAFELPPPPRPPWLDDLEEGCAAGGCPNDPIVNPIDNVTGMFHSVVTVVVAAVAVVISIMLMALFLWRYFFFMTVLKDEKGKNTSFWSVVN